jgi:hypothetical protein
MSDMSPQTVPLNTYLWRRIASVGIEHVFGVPGDFNRKLKRPKTLPAKSHDEAFYDCGVIANYTHLIDNDYSNPPRCPLRRTTIDCKNLFHDKPFVL